MSDVGDGERLLRFTEILEILDVPTPTSSSVVDVQVAFFAAH